jgi:hypothetical protein
MSGVLSNPQIPQGVINLARANVQIVSYPALNVTASFLGAGGISMTPTGPATTFINTLTGRVTSPEPYQPYNIAMHLIKSQNLAAQWEAQRQALTRLGNVLVFTDSAVMPTYAFTDAGIENVGEVLVNGKSVEYLVTLGATYVINNNLWSLLI